MTDDTILEQAKVASLSILLDALALIPKARALKQKQLELFDELERALAQEWAKMTGVNTVTFNERTFHQFKVVYARAVKNGLTQFTFEGNEYLVSYAKYLIKYLEGQFK